MASASRTEWKGAIVIELSHVSFQYGVQSVVKQISLAFTPCSKTAIVGLNGSGKTTLLKLVSGYLKPNAGSISCDGMDMATLSVRQIAQRIAYVPQDFPVGFDFEVFDFVLMGRSAWNDGFFWSKQDHIKVNDALCAVGMADFSRRIVSELSGGERQKILLARSLVQETSVVLLDEPTNHLDVKSREEFLQLISSQLFRDKTVIAVLHDLQAVNRYFPNCVGMKSGRVVYAGDSVGGLAPDTFQQIFDIPASAVF